MMRRLNTHYNVGGMWKPVAGIDCGMLLRLWVLLLLLVSLCGDTVMSDMRLV